MDVDRHDGRQQRGECDAGARPVLDSELRLAGQHLVPVAAAEERVSVPEERPLPVAIHRLREAGWVTAVNGLPPRGA
jgi:hypothetical protein